MRIIVSMTTIPTRIVECLPRFLKSMSEQTAVIDKIYISVPLKPLRASQATFSENEIKNEVQTVKDITKSYFKDGIVEFVYLQKDYGPLSKFVGASHLIEDEDRVVIFDDDRSYKQTLITDMLKIQLKDSESVWGNDIDSHNCISGYAGVILTGKHIKILDGEKENIPECCVMVDDIYFSTVFHKKDIKLIKTGIGTNGIIEDGNTSGNENNPLWRDTDRDRLNKNCYLKQNDEYVVFIAFVCLSIVVGLFCGFISGALCMGFLYSIKYFLYNSTTIATEMWILKNYLRKKVEHFEKCFTF
jgi:hypothetical protein